LDFILKIKIVLLSIGKNKQYLLMKSTFSKKNYYLMLAGLFLICLGYLLMIGGESDNPEIFNPEIFSFRRITLAPMVCLLGFVTIIYAIMWKPKEENNTEVK
jgi:uncharacterized membrane protein